MKPLLQNAATGPALSAHKWALRRICEARAKSRKCGAPGFVKALLLAKRYTQFAKLYDEGVLPNGIVIAIDLQLFWSGGGNCHPGFSILGMKC